MPADRNVRSSKKKGNQALPIGPGGITPFKSSKPSQPPVKVACQYCNRTFNKCGLHSHERACPGRDGSLRRTQAYRAEKARAKAAEKAANARVMPVWELEPWEKCQVPEQNHHLKRPPSRSGPRLDNPANLAASNKPPSCTSSQALRVPHCPPGPRVGPYPNVERNPETTFLGNSHRPKSTLQPAGPPPQASQPTAPLPLVWQPAIPKVISPWSPFNSEAEFKFAKVVLGASLSRSHVETLCEIIHRVSSGTDSFGINSAADLQRYLNDTSTLYMAYRQTLFQAGSATERGEQKGYWRIINPD